MFGLISKIITFSEGRFKVEHSQNTSIGVDIHVPTQVLVLIHDPLDRLGFGLGEGRRALVGLGTRVLRGDVGADLGMELVQEIKDNIKVTVQVNANGSRVASNGGRGVAVLSPAGVGALVPSDTVRVAL